MIFLMILQSHMRMAFYIPFRTVKRSCPQKYDHYFQQDWRDEQNAFLATISEKINRVNHELQKYHEQKIEIYSADEMDIRLKEKTVNPKIGISFFLLMMIHLKSRLIYIEMIIGLM